MTTWELSYVNADGFKQVLAREVTTSQLPAYFAEAVEGAAFPPSDPAERRALARLKDYLGAKELHGDYFGDRTPAIQITRTDWTREALQQQWFDAFYDITKSGAKRRRYKKPQIERDWEDWAKRERAVVRGDKALNKGGNEECPDCGARWSKRAASAGLFHDCTEGLIPWKDS